MLHKANYQTNSSESLVQFHSQFVTLQPFKISNKKKDTYATCTKSEKDTFFIRGYIHDTKYTDLVYYVNDDHPNLFLEYKH